MKTISNKVNVTYKETVIESKLELLSTRFHINTEGVVSPSPSN